MSMFNRYFANHFGGCLMLAEAHDHHRVRDVRIYRIPGTAEVVGVTDGVDCWVCPTSINPFSVDLQAIIKDLEGDRLIKLPVRAPGVPAVGAPGKRPRTRVLIEDEPTPSPRPRNRVLIDPSQPQPRQRIRIN